MWAYSGNVNKFKRTYSVKKKMKTVSSNDYRAFVQHMASLRTAITDPGGLALELYSEGLIDMLARQKINTSLLTQLERSQELVEKLEVKIAENKEAFDTFLSILDRDPTMEDICRDLRATRGICIYHNVASYKWLCLYVATCTADYYLFTNVLQMNLGLLL